MTSNRSNLIIEKARELINKSKINEQGENVKRVKAKIKQEKMRDKRRFDDMLDDARTADTRAKNRSTNEEKTHDKCGTPECCGQCETAVDTGVGTDEYANYVKKLTPGQ